MADIRAKVSSFGKALSGMVMPNIGAFIAWGFLTALFIDTGWLPNAQLSELVGPTLKFLIPVMIAGQGGQNVAGQRGRVIGSIAVMGAIIGSEYTMLMGAMLMGPLAGFIIKKWDEFADTWKPAGLEMLIDNFSLGILGMLLMIAGYYGVGPFMGAILVVLQAGVEVLVNARLLPLLAVFIEPAKVLFLNNAIGNGVFVPIATEQAKTAGQSIMYMLESNPGPGLGVLLAYCLFCKDESTKQSAPGAVIIHFLGGIHEIYFPYVLMNPKVIIAPIAGNIVSILVFTIFGLGLVGPASPGSIIAFLAMAPQGKAIMILLGVLAGAAVSFLIASPIVRTTEVTDLASAQAAVSSMKAGGTSADNAAWAPPPWAPPASATASSLTVPTSSSSTPPWTRFPPTPASSSCSRTWPPAPRRALRTPSLWSSITSCPTPTSTTCTTRWSPLPLPPVSARPTWMS